MRLLKFRAFGLGLLEHLACLEVLVAFLGRFCKRRTRPLTFDILLVSENWAQAAVNAINTKQNENFFAYLSPNHEGVFHRFENERMKRAVERCQAET